MRLYRGIDLHQKDCFLWAIDNWGKTHLIFWCHLRLFGERGQPGSLTVTNPYGGSMRTVFFRAIREGSSRITMDCGYSTLFLTNNPLSKGDGEYYSVDRLPLMGVDFG